MAEAKDITSFHSCFCSKIHFFGSKIYSIGSSIVIIWQDLLVFISSIIAARVVDFQDQVGQATKTIPLVFFVNVFKISGNHNS
jgi:hypothetical protein